MVILIFNTNCQLFFGRVSVETMPVWRSRLCTYQRDLPCPSYQLVSKILFYCCCRCCCCCCCCCCFEVSSCVCSEKCVASGCAFCRGGCLLMCVPGNELACGGASVKKNSNQPNLLIFVFNFCCFRNNTDTIANSIECFCDDKCLVVDRKLYIHYTTTIEYTIVDCYNNARNNNRCQHWRFSHRIRIEQCKIYNNNLYDRLVKN
jgi:hypothetical protein